MSCLLNLPLNFLGGLLRSPASGCTTHRSSTRLQRNEKPSEMLLPSPSQPSSQQHHSRSLAAWHPRGHFSRRHSPSANLCQTSLRSMQLEFICKFYCCPELCSWIGGTINKSLLLCTASPLCPLLEVQTEQPIF